MTNQLNEMANNLIIIITTYPDQESADNLIQLLLKKQLAACIQQTQITSDYLWEGNLEKSSEIKLEIKTLAQLFDEIKDCIQQNHSYDCPEVIAVPVTKSSKQYADWLHQSVKAS